MSHYPIPTIADAIAYVIQMESSWGVASTRILSTRVDHWEEFVVVTTGDYEWSVWHDGHKIYGEA